MIMSSLIDSCSQLKNLIEEYNKELELNRTEQLDEEFIVSIMINPIIQEVNHFLLILEKVLKRDHIILNGKSFELDYLSLSDSDFQDDNLRRIKLGLFNDLINLIMSWETSSTDESNVVLLTDLI